eukprot:443770-Pelagomonas_calceolata.AAC.6
MSGHMFDDWQHVQFDALLCEAPALGCFRAEPVGGKTAVNSNEAVGLLLQERSSGGDFSILLMALQQPAQS